QAEHGNIGRLGDLGALAEILAVGHRQLEQLDVRPVLQPVVDLQASGAVLAVDEDLGLVGGHGLLTREFRASGNRPTGEEGMVMWAAARSSPAAAGCGAFVTRARLHAASASGGVATEAGRTSSWRRDISSAGQDVKGGAQSERRELPAAAKLWDRD